MGTFINTVRGQVDLARNFILQETLNFKFADHIFTFQKIPGTYVSDGVPATTLRMVWPRSGLRHFPCTRACSSGLSGHYAVWARAPIGPQRKTDQGRCNLWWAELFRDASTGRRPRPAWPPTRYSIHPTWT